MRLLLFVITLIILSVVSAEWAPNPVANPKAVVTSTNVRFTVLTAQMIRLEYSPTGTFRDSASLAILNRQLNPPQFTSQSSSGYLSITTDFVTLVYKENSGMFTSDNLNITVKIGNGTSTVWNIDSQPTGNLLGTVRTLDDQNGAIPLYCPSMGSDDLYDNHCTLGVISRDGWAIYDDSESAIWDNDPTWRWFVTPASDSCNVSYNNRVDCNPGDGNQGDCEKKGCCYAPTAKLGVPWCFFSGPAQTTYQDIYFLGHGHNYIQALQDFTQIAGPIPTFPRYIFGPQYSRWHAYNEADEVDIIENWYEDLNIPLDVLVLDMDWHYTYNTGAPTCNPGVNGWTGYTWDRTLFPNPSRFLKWAHAKGLHITNNMHPAAGVQCSEEQYPPFAVAMGVDPSTNDSINYAMQNKTFASNFFEIVLKPLSNLNVQDSGIDYWWIDYQQGESVEAPGINPTFWVNYAFSTTQSWWGSSTRPLIMARWGGLGNHRFSTIGFSGDVTTSWQSLAFQPYFSATASNVGFFWSHDLGGFAGQPDPELFVRWIQWGAFSNLLRTHCDGKVTGGGDTRDIWEYPAYYFNIMRAAFKLRSNLVPYIYTQHALSYTNSIGLLRPMYYFYPEENDAYNVPTQYLFGDSFLVSPVVAPNQGNNLTGINVWIPTGVWVEYNSGQAFTGPQMISRNYTLNEIPAFVPAGAIIPMRSELDISIIGSAQQIPKVLRIDFYPQAVGTFSSLVLEDDGVSTAYQNGSYTSTTLGLQTTPNAVVINIDAASGNGFEGQATQRSYQLNLVGAWPADTVQFNGNDIPFNPIPSDSSFSEDDFWTYDATTLTVLINLITSVSTSTASSAKITFANSLQDPLLLSGYTRKLDRLQQCKDLLDNEWGNYYPSNYPNLLSATGSGLNSNVSTIYQTLQQFDSLFQSAIGELNALKATPEKTICLGYLQTA